MWQFACNLKGVNETGSDFDIHTSIPPTCCAYSHTYASALTNSGRHMGALGTTFLAALACCLFAYHLTVAAIPSGFHLSLPKKAQKETLVWQINPSLFGPPVSLEAQHTQVHITTAGVSVAAQAHTSSQHTHSLATQLIKRGVNGEFIIIGCFQVTAQLFLWKYGFIMEAQPLCPHGWE